MKKINLLFLLSFLFSSFIFISCEKEDDHDHIISNDGMQARMAYTKNGYTEIEVNPIIKLNCYFSDWNKDIMTPVSGLFEYYDIDGNWVASINFGDGTCDEWATKTWDTKVFPDYPTGSENFSVFNYKDKK
jgi:hypothetical protein